MLSAVAVVISCLLVSSHAHPGSYSNGFNQQPTYSQGMTTGYQHHWLQRPGNPVKGSWDRNSSPHSGTNTFSTTQKNPPFNSFGQNPSNSFGQNSFNSFGQNSFNSFGQNPSNTFGQKPPSRFGENPMNSFGQSPPSRFGEGPPSRFGEGPPSRFGEGPPNRFGQGPPNRFGGNPSNDIMPRPSITAPPKPGAFPAYYPEDNSVSGCREGSRLYKAGDKWTPKGGCARHSCSDGGKISILGCPSIEDGEECARVGEDPRQPWPQCCPRLDCPA